MNGIGELATHIAGLKSASMTAALRDKLRLHVADILGAWVGGAATAEGRALLGFRRDLRALEVAGGGLADDLMINVSLARLSEVDDIHLASMTTAGSVVVPAALTIAAALPELAGDGLAPAMLAGYEAMIRLGLAIKGPDVLYRGIWPTYFGAAFGTAATAARLLRLDGERTAHALALAFTMGAPSVGQHHAVTTARWLSVGNAARNGLMAALAARAGFTSDIEVLRSGLLKNVYAIDADLLHLAPDHDSTSKLLEVSFKPWCAARQTMAATQALREIIADGVAPQEIERIEAFVPPPHLKMIDHGVRPGDRASRLTSLPYQMAVAALQPATALDVGQTAADIGMLQSFMARVTVQAEAALLDDYPRRWPARVVVHTRGNMKERRITEVKGDPAKPMAEADVQAKFRRLVEPGLGNAAHDLYEAAHTGLWRPDGLTGLRAWLERIGGSSRNA